MNSEPKWLLWAREIQALGQTGLAFASNNYEIQRNKRILELASEIVAEYTNLDFTNTKKSLMNQPGYATPKVDVRAAVVHEKKILMVKEISDGKWAMPGGWADVGDIPSEAAVREAWEESGFNVEPLKVVGVYDANRNPGNLEFFHAVKIVYLCKLISGEATTSSETSEVKFFSFDELPELSTNRTNHKHINDIQKHVTDFERPTDFD